MEERRSRLLALGLDLFGERSFDELSVDEIAQAAGISKGLLYHYFPSKRDYYVAVVRFAAERLLEDTAPVDGEASPQALYAGLDLYLEFVDRHGRAYTALVRGGIGSDPEVAEMLEKTRQTFADRILARLVDTPAMPLVRVALRGWIGLVEAASLDWLERRDLPREQLRELLAQMLLAALLAAGAPIPANL